MNLHDLVVFEWGMAVGVWLAIGMATLAVYVHRFLVRCQRQPSRASIVVTPAQSTVTNDRVRSSTNWSEPAVKGFRRGDR